MPSDLKAKLLYVCGPGKYLGANGIVNGSDTQSVIDNGKAIHIFDCGPFYLIKWIGDYTDAKTGTRYRLENKHTSWDYSYLMPDAYWPLEYASAGIEINSSEFRVLKLYANSTKIGIYSDSGDWSKPYLQDIYIPSLIIPKGNASESSIVNLYQDAYLRKSSSDATMVKNTLVKAGQFKHKSIGLQVNLVDQANRSDNAGTYYLWTYGDFGVLTFAGVKLGDVYGQGNKTSSMNICYLSPTDGSSAAIQYGSGMLHLDYDHTSGRSMIVGVWWSTGPNAAYLKICLGNDEASSKKLFTNARLVGQVFFRFKRDTDKPIQNSNIIGVNLHTSSSISTFLRKEVLTNWAYKSPYSYVNNYSAPDWQASYLAYYPFAIEGGVRNNSSSQKGGGTIQQDGSDNFFSVSNLPNPAKNNRLLESWGLTGWTSLILGVQNLDWRNDLPCRSWLTPCVIQYYQNGNVYRRFWRGRGFTSDAYMFGQELVPNNQDPENKVV